MSKNDFIKMLGRFGFVILVMLHCQQKTQNVHLLAVGDVMMHASVQAYAARVKTGYHELFSRIKPDLEQADLTFANLETQVDDSSYYSGYPHFNAPADLLAALKHAGVDLLSTANNHSMDRLGPGHRRTLENLRKNSLLYVGSGRNQREADTPVQVTINEIRLGFLGYSYDTNGMPQPLSPQEPKVNILNIYDPGSVDKVKADIRSLRRDVDFVIVSLHWGLEYKLAPEIQQRRVGSELFEAGADVILGHHPHVLQPMETYITKDQRHCFIIYSLGNFISHMNLGFNWHSRFHHNARTGDSILLHIYFEKSWQKKILQEEQIQTRIKKVEYTPIYTFSRHYQGLASVHTVNIQQEILRLQKQEKFSEEWQNFLNYRQQLIHEQLSPVVFSKSE